MRPKKEWKSDSIKLWFRIQKSHIQKWLYLKIYCQIQTKPKINDNKMCSITNLSKTVSFHDPELGLKQICSPRSKQSGTTDHSSEEIDDHIDKYGIEPVVQDFTHQPIINNRILSELKNKVNKLREHQLEMDKKFMKRINALQGKLATMNNEGCQLKKMASDLKKDITEMKSDMKILKKCHRSRKQVIYFERESYYFIRQQLTISRQNSRAKSTRLFKGSNVKCK